MASLHVKYGTMGSAKTLDLLRTAYNYEERGKKVLLLTSVIDDRYGVGKIKTRLGLERDATVVKQDDDIVNIYVNKLLEQTIDVVLVDESMFLTSKQIWQLSDIVDEFNIPVICYSLISDYRGFSFEASNTLMTIADKREEIKAICHCGRKTTMNARIVDGKVVKEGKQIDVGGNDKYIGLCRRCWKEGRLE